MARHQLHFEPYVHLAGVGHDRALIAWGGFFFRRADGELKLVDDEELETEQLSRTESIGERSEPYGRAQVLVVDSSGKVAAQAETTTTNHVWVEGLRPDTPYDYEIRVDGRPWLNGERYDWIREGGRASLRPSGRQYQCRFRTHAAEDAAVPLTFAVLGDFGIGIFSDHEDSRRQLAIARALEHAVTAHDVRLVLTTGDNIYLSHEGDEATGAEDDDWFYSFYQPYRYVLDRVPFYPAVGNHDGAETENSDDRSQLDDNYFLRQRFSDERNASRASVDPGLFYRFEFGATASFVCLDTTMDDKCGTRYFDEASHHDFLNESFPSKDDRSRWVIPYSHHPVFCAGPEHRNTGGMEQTLVPLFERSGVRLVLAGHEHNFQYSRHHDIHYIVSGAGGQLRRDAPTNFHEARTVAWAAQGHFLVVALDADRATVHVLEVDAHGRTAPLIASTPDGQPFRTPIVIARDR
jgi:tartrate-resistant acid phosphatase type 5